MAELLIEKEYTYTFDNFLKSFGLIILTGHMLSVKLLPPDTPLMKTILQVIFINLWVYWIHRLCHILPESPYNYHIYSHHHKKLELDRPIELFYEFFANMFWFILLIIFQWLTGVEIVPDILIIFIGAWYSSVHVLNLSLIPNIEHKVHHTELNYNYGPSYMDFIFGTLKVEEGYSEDSQVINGVVLYVIYDIVQRILAKPAVTPVAVA